MASFLEKIKIMFNIGGIDVQFNVPETIEKHTGQIKGQVILEAKSERTVKKVHMFLEQHINKRDHQGNESVDIIKIGSKDFDINTTLKAGETKSIDFDFHFEPQKDFGDKVADKMMEQGGLLSVVGAMGATMHNLEKTYTLQVKTEIEGALWRPREAYGVKLI